MKDSSIQAAIRGIKAQESAISSFPSSPVSQASETINESSGLASRSSLRTVNERLLNSYQNTTVPQVANCTTGLAIGKKSTSFSSAESVSVTLPDFIRDKLKALAQVSLFTRRYVLLGRLINIKVQEKPAPTPSFSDSEPI